MEQSYLDKIMAAFDWYVSNDAFAYGTPWIIKRLSNQWGFTKEELIKMGFDNIDVEAYCND